MEDNILSFIYKLDDDEAWPCIEEFAEETFKFLKSQDVTVYGIVIAKTTGTRRSPPALVMHAMILYGEWKENTVEAFTELVCPLYNLSREKAKIFTDSEAFRWFHGHANSVLGYKEDTPGWEAHVRIGNE